MTRGKAEAIGVLVNSLGPALALGPPLALDTLEALAELLAPSPNAMAHGACELAERQILNHRMAMTELDVLCTALRGIMGDNEHPVFRFGTLG